jgi:Flp pilus assembly protein TadG
MTRSVCSRQRGQMLIILALLMVTILAMVGVAVDLGFGYEHRREIQNAVDSAAVAGALGLGRHIQYATLSVSQRSALGLTTDYYNADTVIQQEITNAAVMSMPPFPQPDTATGRLSSNLSWPPSGGTGSLSAFYVLTDGTTVAIGGGTPPATAVGVRVVADASYSTMFARVLGAGFLTVPVAGTARAMLRPTVTTLGVAGAPFIVCGGTPSGTGAWLAPNGSNGSNGGGAVNILTTTTPQDVDYNTWVGTNFMVHWSQIGSQPRAGSDCGGGGNMNGLADPTQSCTPTSSTALPCAQPWRGGTVAGTTNQLVAGLPGCTGTSWNNCVMLLPVSTGCGGTNCTIVTFAPFIIFDGTLQANAAISPQSGCNSNCHIGQLLPAGMVDGQAGTGVINPATPGTFTTQLSCDPVGTSGCSL